MLQLPSNCRAGKISVSPANWKTQSAKVTSIWKITYWFYDDNLGQRHKVTIKGMNRYTTLIEKQDFVRYAIDQELELLQVKGYNYITKKETVAFTTELSGTTPVAEALQYGFSKLKVVPTTLACIKSCLEKVTGAIKKLHYDRIYIMDIRRRHIKLILEACGDLSDCNYNHYRSYLSMIFRQLVEVEAIEANPVRDLIKKAETRKLRQELDKEKERPIVRKFLSEHYPEFWTFVNIFFHSGSRITEFVRLRAMDVDIPNQRFKILIKKGRKPKEQWKPIKDIVVPDWIKAIEGAKDTDYIFSVGLVPGAKMIRPEQITRRWKNHVKKPVDKGGLGITADLYSLKHSNLDETAEALQKHKEAIKQASDQAGHTTPVITLNTYLQGETGRQNATVKGVWNEF
jgi:site-specific recombinase XerC